MTLCSQSVFCELIIPDHIDRSDYAKLQTCVGMIVLMPTFKPFIKFCDIDYKSYKRGGKDPDFLQLLGEFKSRFYGVIHSVSPRKVTISMFEMADSSSLFNILNTGPFEYDNGDQLVFLPPLIPNKISLPSIDTELIFPMVLPYEAARELMSKVMAGMFYSYCKNNEIPIHARPPSVDILYYKGKSYNISGFTSNYLLVESYLKNIFTSLMFGVHEGLYILLSAMPNILTRDTTDAFTNTLMQLQSTSRLAVQMIRPPTIPDRLEEGAIFRDNFTEMLSNYLNLIARLHDLLSLRSFAKVCKYNDGTGSVPEKTICRCVRA